MAYFRCDNGSKPVTLIDGVETEEDIKLKSLGLTFKQVTRTMYTGYNLNTQDLKCAFADINGFNALIADGANTTIKRYLWDDSSCRWVVQSDVAPNDMTTLSNIARIGNKIYFIVKEDSSAILYVYYNKTYTKLYTSTTLRTSKYHTLIPSETDSNIIYVLGVPASTSDGILQKMYKYNISANTLTEVKNFVTNYDYMVYASYYKGKIHAISYIDSNYKQYTYTDSSGFTDTGMTPPYTPLSLDSIFEFDGYLYMQTSNVGTNGFAIWRFDGTTWTCVTNIFADEPIYFAFKYQNKQYVYKKDRITYSGATNNDEGCVYKMLTNTYERVN